MSELRAHLVRRIASTGPMTVADYMSECLLHPKHGYYTTRPVFGAKGDFVTAPEISQMFGEMIGLCIAQCWMDQGCPTPMILAEAGPGRGTMMADILRATRQVPGFHAAAQIHLIEASAHLRQVQEQTLSGHDAAWVTRIQDLPEGPLFLIANEFLDALPIRQFQRAPDGWHECMVTLKDQDLAFGLSAVTPIAALAHRMDDTVPGQIVEYCPQLPSVIAELSERHVAHGGSSIIIDYGNWGALGDTLQSVQDHRHDPPLASPGAADITAHVDFREISRAALAAGAVASPMVPQGVLLERLGITERARALAQSIQDPNQLSEHIAAHRRLTHPEEMGSLFKAMAITAPDASVPPGFEQ